MDEIATRTAPEYEADLHGWALCQAELLRAGRLSELDARNIAEELIDVASAQFDKLESALRVLLSHMLKWDHQPERRGRSWEATIREQRNRIPRLMRRNPSLKSSLGEALSDAWEDARAVASGETGLHIDTFPQDCPYTWANITECPFLLDR